MNSAVLWLKYCQYGGNLYKINQSIENLVIYNRQVLILVLSKMELDYFTFFLGHTTLLKEYVLSQLESNRSTFCKQGQRTHFITKPPRQIGIIYIFIRYNVYDHYVVCDARFPWGKKLCFWELLLENTKNKNLPGKSAKNTT